MDMNEYQKWTFGTAKYPEKGECSDRAINYNVVALAGEAGELCNKWKKVLRGDKDKHIQIEFMAYELGDCLWYLARAAAEMGYDLDEIAAMNKEKLEQRNKEGKIQGDGDER